MCLSKRLNQQHVSNGAWIAHVQRSVCHHSSKRQTARAFLSKRRGVRQNQSLAKRKHTRSRREVQFRFAPKKRFRKERSCQVPTYLHVMGKDDDSSVRRYHHAPQCYLFAQTVFHFTALCIPLYHISLFPPCL